MDESCRGAGNEMVKPCLPSVAKGSLIHLSSSLTVLE